MLDPTWDPVFKTWVVPASCPVCEKCWLIVNPDDPMRGRCVYGGHYGGYVEVLDGDDKCEENA